MKIFLFSLIFGTSVLLGGCLGGGDKAPVLPPELQEGLPGSEGALPPVSDPLAGLPLIEPIKSESPTKVDTQPQTALPPEVAPTAALNCEAITQDLETSFVDMNFCDSDSDCAVASGSCPFGCYLFHNVAIDFADYQPTLTAYQNNCDPCEYKCASAPRASDRRCRSGRCVDARYE